jgi:hypothetical protein
VFASLDIKTLTLIERAPPIRFKKVKQVLQFYFDETHEHTRALDFSRPQIDGVDKYDTDGMDTKATIGYYLKILSPFEYAIIFCAYREILDGYGIARRLKALFPNKTINNFIVDSERRRIESYLRKLFTQVGIIEK